MLEVRYVSSTLGHVAVVPPDPRAGGVAPGALSSDLWVWVPAVVVFPQSVHFLVLRGWVEVRVVVRIVAVPTLARYFLSSLFHRVHISPVLYPYTSGAFYVPHTLGNTTRRGEVGMSGNFTVRSNVFSVVVPALGPALTAQVVLGLVSAKSLTMSLRVFVAEHVCYQWFNVQTLVLYSVKINLLSLLHEVIISIMMLWNPDEPVAAHSMELNLTLMPANINSLNISQLMDTITPQSVSDKGTVTVVR